MAATDSVLYVQPRAQAAAVGNTGSVSFFAARSSTGLYTSTTIRKADSRGKKVIRPVGVPMVDDNGMLMQQWTDWFVYIERQFLNMLNGPTLPDVTKYITVGQATAIAVAAVQSGLAQQANANAQAIQTMREVVQTAQLPGAVQIPPPKLYSDVVAQPVYEAAPSGGGGGE